MTRTINAARLAKRLVGAALAAALLLSGAIAVRAAREQLVTNEPTPHAVTRPADEPWLAAARDISLRSPKGDILRGWVLGSTNGAAVLFVHGSGADRTQLLPEAHLLAAAGYGILVFDRPGDGESGGVPYRPEEWDFIRLAVDTLAAEPGVRPGAIGAYGFSSGASFLADSAAKDPRLQAVVLAGCYTEAHEYIRHYHGNGPLRGLPSLWAAESAGFAFPHPLESVPAIAPRALFLIVGDRDDVDPPDLSRQLYAAASEPKTLWIVPGAAHGGYSRVAGAEYARRLVAFYDRALLGR